ncbi:MAG: glycosyltransferase family 2 protein [Akkermansiaceae bacterium]
MSDNNYTGSHTVTVYIPNFNGGDFLQLAIDSLVCQTYESFKIEIIDDGSTDDSARNLNHLKNSKVIYNKHNRGKAEVLNEAFQRCQSKYIVLHDSDDVSSSDRIERQVAFMEANPKIGCSCSFVNYISSSGNLVGRGQLDLLTLEKLQTYLCGDDPFGLFCPSVILRREVFNDLTLRFRGQFWPADDIDLWNRIAEAGWQVQVQPEYLVDYRVHHASAVTSNFVKTRMQFEWVRSCLRARRKGLPEPSIEEFRKEWSSAPLLRKIDRWRKIRAKGYYRGAGFAVAEKSYLRAVSYGIASLMLQPGYVIKRLSVQRGKS